MKITPLYIHIFLGLGVVVVVTLLAIRGVLVSTNLSPLPVGAFFKAQTYFALVNRPVAIHLDTIFFRENEKVISLDGSTVLTIPLNATAIQRHQLHSEEVWSYEIDQEVTLLMGAALEEQTMYLKNPTASFLGLANTTTAVLANPISEDEWQIEFQTFGGERSQAPAQYPKLSSQQKPYFDGTAGTISYLSCTPFCSLIVFSLERNEEIARVPVFADASYEPAFTTTEVLFVDISNQLVGLKRPDNEIIVVHFSTELLQSIRLENERNTVSYLGYFPETKQMAFALYEKSGDFTQLALYAADRPSLHLIKKFPSTTKFEILSKANLIRTDDTLLDLTGAEVMKLDSKKLISWK